MEHGGDFYTHHTNRSRAQDSWSPNNSSRFNWSNTNNSTLFTAADGRRESTTSAPPEPTSSHAHIFTHQNLPYRQYQQLGLYGGEGSHFHPDPHLTCLRLGKRHYFEDNFNFPVGEGEMGGFSIGKRGKPCYSVVGTDGHVGPSSTATVPRCQVEGCHVALINAKDYHRRHKVCEMHSKAPKVMVLGLEQRFCQQCSRFHVVSEFDESKRSCRRRLAGHNERRRKSAQDSVSRNSCHEKLIAERLPFLASSTGRALSLLSSKADSWISSSELTLRSSAALHELIAEHRAAILSKHLHHNSMDDLGDQSQPNSNTACFIPHQHQILANTHNHWDQFQENGAQAVTLDLMQSPSSAFGFLSARAESNKEVEEECSELWNTWAGAHQV